jgi:hypothetical protein
MMSALLAGSMVLGFLAAALAPAPARAVPNWVQIAVGMAAPASFCVVMALTSSGQREAGAVAMWVLGAALALLLWVLRAPNDENGFGEDGGDDGDGGIGRGGPSGGPATPDDGLRWDWDRFETEFRAYAARSTGDRELVGA